MHQLKKRKKNIFRAQCTALKVKCRAVHKKKNTFCHYYGVMNGVMPGTIVEFSVARLFGACKHSSIV